MKIRRRHSLGLEEARTRAARIASDLESQYNVASSWEGDALNVQGNGISGQLRVDDDYVELDVELGFAMKLMEGPIRTVIEQTIDKELA